MVTELTPDELLRQTPLFRSLERKVQDQVSLRADFRSFKEGDRILEAGMPGRALLVVLKGSVDVYAREGNTRLRVARVEAGELLGEIAFFMPDHPRTADVIGKSPGLLAFIPLELYQEWCRTSPGSAAALEKAVLNVLADRLEETNRLMAHLMAQYRSSGLTSALQWLRGLVGARP